MGYSVRVRAIKVARGPATKNQCRLTSSILFTDDSESLAYTRLVIALPWLGRLYAYEDIAKPRNSLITVLK